MRGKRMPSFEDRLHPDVCALVVVDMQNDFCHEDGACARLGADVSLVQAIVPNVQALIETARSLDIPRIFLRVEHNEWFDTLPWKARGRGGETLNIDRVPIVEEGTWGADFYNIVPQPDELVLIKRRYSGFAYTPLELALRAKDAYTVILCGTQTNVCVESTANDALARGFYPVVISDCVATGSMQLHETALLDIAERNGPPLTLAELARAWGVPERAMPAAMAGA
jgi:ureidoacrylate peracid hydrolase